MGTVDCYFDRAASDREHGAAEIERRLIEDLLRDRRGWTTAALARGAARLLAGQAAMANMRNLARWLVTENTDEVEGWLKERAELLAGLDRRLGEAARPFIEDCSRVLTLSRSSAVAAAVTGAWRHDWRGEIVVFDGSPVGCGAEQARRLAEIIPAVRSQPDAAMPSWFAGGGVLVVIGADAVSPVRLINACGTRMLLELAEARSVRVLLVADSGKDLPDDELDEILEAGPMATEAAPDRSWPIFQAVPMALVSDRVAE